MDKKFLTVKKRSEVQKNLTDFFEIGLNPEKVSILSAIDRFSYEDFYAPIDIPGFKKSLVDGYAVNSDDTRGASNGNPIPLNLRAKLLISKKLKGKLNSNETVFVPTGGVVPQGADAMVMIENSEEKAGEVFIMHEAHKGENLINIGDDIRNGEVILSKGECINANMIAALRAFGRKEISVYKKIRIGIFSTGNELKDGGDLPEGKIFDINEYALFAEAQKENFSPKLYGIVRDNPDEIKEVLQKALSENDIVLMSGGTSKGMFDFTVSVINEIGKPGVLIHGLHLSPGKPTVFGVVSKKLVIGLSGNPLASFLVFREVIVPLIYKKCNLIEKKRKIVAILSENLPSRKGREEFVMGELFVKNGEQFVRPLFSESAFISPLIKGNGIITVPLMSEGYKKGKKVIFELW